MGVRWTARLSFGHFLLDCRGPLALTLLGKSVAHRILKRALEDTMATITKKELIDRIADGTGHRGCRSRRSCNSFSTKSSTSWKR
jgi:hypothetical protein